MTTRLAGASAPAELWDGTVASGFGGGNGSSGSPYLIYSGAELAYLASQVNGGNKYNNTYFELAADLDLDGREWTPIGGVDQYFRGKFDGKGHVIANLSITANAEEAGLFGKVQDAELRNVGLESVDIDIAETTLTGGLVGNMFNKASGTQIENVYVTGEIVVGINVHVGGLVGRASGPAGGNIKSSYSTANIAAGVQGAKVGGIAGTTIDTNVINSYATGNMQGGGDKQRIGGLVGYTTTAIGGTSYWNSDASHSWTRTWLTDPDPVPVVTKLGVAFSTEENYPANANGATTASGMKLADFLDVLNDDPDSIGAWKFSAGRNDGYPVIDGVGAGRGPTVAGHPAPTTVDEGSGATFTVTATNAVSYQWQVDDGTGFANVDDAAPYSGATTSTLAIAEATPGMSGYKYRAITGDIAAFTTASEEAALTVNAIPAAPTLTDAVAGDSTVQLVWNPVSGATGYKVYQSDVSGTDGAEAASAGESVSSADATGLTNGITYYFTVTALNGNLESPFSNEVAATPATVPDAPTNVAAAAGNGRATLTFTAPAGDGGSAIVGYEVYDSQDRLVGTGEASPITVAGLTNGTAYTFTVKALNGVGGGAPSGASNTVTPTAPPPSRNDDDGSDGSPAPSPAPTGTTAATGGGILVNGKPEQAGTVTTEQVNGREATILAMDEEKLRLRLEQEDAGAVITLAIEAGGGIAAGELNGRMVRNLQDKQAVVEIRTDRATYILPADRVDLDELAARFGDSVALQDIKVRIEIATPAPETLQLVDDAATKGGFTLLVPPLDFKVRAEFDGHTEEVTRFGAYVTRMIAIPEGIDPGRITTGAVVEPDGAVRHVPTKIIEVDGKFYAQISGLTNSTYAVIANAVEFKDLASHWARNVLNGMGSRMIVSGTGGDTFSPDREVTRAEFAAMLVRGLGLRPESGEGVFADVAASAGYGPAIGTAHAYRLIDGFGDGAFRPNDSITREQAMQIVAKAMKITGLSERLGGLAADEALRPYRDADNISSWATTGIALCVEAGIVTGRDGAGLAPKASLTRAEAAVLIARLLEKSDWI